MFSKVCYFYCSQRREEIKVHIMSNSSQERITESRTKDDLTDKRSMPHYSHQYWAFPNDRYYIQLTQSNSNISNNGENSTILSGRDVQSSKGSVKSRRSVLLSGNGILPVKKSTDVTPSVWSSGNGVLPTRTRPAQSSQPHFYVSQKAELPMSHSANSVPSSKESQNYKLPILPPANGALPSKGGQNGGPLVFSAGKGTLLAMRKSYDGEYKDGQEKSEENENRNSKKRKKEVVDGQLSILKRISNGIVFGLEAFFYKYVNINITNSHTLIHSFIHSFIHSHRHSF